MATKQAPIQFIQKIKARMGDENLGVTELARKIGVSHPTIVELITYGKKPSFDTTVALAQWLQQSPVSVLREAGLLPAEGPENDVKFEDWKYLLDQLSPEDQEELRQIAEMKINKRQKDQILKNLHKGKVKA
jgi:transcriptional regulator with XRE-family HTH domain